MIEPVDPKGDDFELRWVRGVEGWQRVER
jgi:hypothetical protein